MIKIVSNGKDRRRIFRFVCKQCGCIQVGMELVCPMTFCRCKNTSFDIVNKDELESKAYYKYIDGKLQYCK